MLVQFGGEGEGEGEGEGAKKENQPAPILFGPSLRKLSFEFSSGLLGNESTATQGQLTNFFYKWKLRDPNSVMLPPV